VYSIFCILTNKRTTGDMSNKEYAWSVLYAKGIPVDPKNRCWEIDGYLIIDKPTEEEALRTRDAVVALLHDEVNKGRVHGVKLLDVEKGTFNNYPRPFRTVSFSSVKYRTEENAPKWIDWVLVWIVETPISRTPNYSVTVRDACEWINRPGSSQEPPGVSSPRESIMRALGNNGPDSLEITFGNSTQNGTRTTDEQAENNDQEDHRHLKELGSS
jgi:hypothetical protein